MKKFLSIILAVLLLISTFSFAFTAFAATSVDVKVKSSQSLFTAISGTYNTGDTFELRIRWKSDQLLRDADFSTVFDNTAFKVVSQEVNSKLPNVVTNISDDIQSTYGKVTANFSSYDGVDYYTTEYLVKYQIQILDTASSTETIKIDFAEASGVPTTGNLAEEVVYVFNNQALSANSSAFTLSAKLFDVTSTTDPTTESTTASTSATTASTTASTATSSTDPSESVSYDYYFLSGSFNDWATIVMSLSVSGDVATADVLIGEGTFTFKIVDCGTSYGYNGEIADSTSETGITMRSGAENATLMATGGWYNFQYNITTKKLIVTQTSTSTESTETTAATDPTETTEAVASDYYLTGSFNSWSLSETSFTVNADGTATVDVVLDAGTYEFKIIDQGTLYGYSGTELSNITSPSGITMKSDGGNAILEASGGTYTFSYTPTTRKIIITYTNSTDNEYKPGETDPTEKPTDSDIGIKDPTKPNEDCQFGHSYDEGTVTKKSTYFAQGRKVQVCSVCGATRTLKTPMLKLAKPTFELKGGKKLFTLKYNKVKDATGFQIKYKTKGSTVIKLVKAKKTVVKEFNNLAKGRYKVQIRAYIKKNGKKAYSNWTTTKKVRVK